MRKIFPPRRRFFERGSDLRTGQILRKRYMRMILEGLLERELSGIQLGVQLLQLGVSGLDGDIDYLGHWKNLNLPQFHHERLEIVQARLKRP